MSAVVLQAVKVNANIVLRKVNVANKRLNTVWPQMGVVFNLAIGWRQSAPSGLLGTDSVCGPAQLHQHQNWFEVCLLCSWFFFNVVLL